VNSAKFVITEFAEFTCPDPIRQALRRAYRGPGRGTIIGHRMP
jgi:hypothetical protein